MKKFLSFFTAITLLFGTISFVQAIPLKDLDEGYRYLPAIQNLYQMGVISGYPDGTFRPEGDLNRAELLKIVMLSAQIKSTGQSSNCFKDVGSEWFAEYVCMAKTKGWIEGYADGTFKPSQVVNRVEALKMLLEVYNVELITPEFQQFADVDKSAWYSKYLATAVSMQLLELGSTDIHYNPGASMKRGVFSYYVDNLLKTTGNEENTAALPAGVEWLNYSDNDLSFAYPKTFLGTPLQESSDKNLASTKWEVTRQDNTIYIRPNFESEAAEFGSTYEIKIIKTLEDAEKLQQSITWGEGSTKNGCLPLNNIQLENYTVCAFEREVDEGLGRVGKYYAIIPKLKDGKQTPPWIYIFDASGGMYTNYINTTLLSSLKIK